MKRLNLVLAVTTVCGAIALSATTFARKSELAQHLSVPAFSSRTSSAQPLNVAFLVYPNVEVLDLSGPLDVFVKANGIAPHSFNIYTVSAQTPTVNTDADALTLTARYTLQNSPRPDIIIVPGSSETQVEKIGANPRLKAWLKRNASPSQTVMSVCTGAFILGRAGLLDGKNSTSHWFVLDSFQRQFPKTRAFQGVTFMQDGNIVTTAGVTSGIEGACFLIEKIKGKSVADTVAKAIQFRRGTPAYPNPTRARVILEKIDTRKKRQKLSSAHDPVCRMMVKDDTPYTVLYQGKLYGFCSPICQGEFKQQPAKYIKAPK